MVAGGRGESVFQPEWSPDGVLHFVADRSGWWNLYRWRDGRREALAPMQAEFGVPAWSLGTRTYAFESADRLFCRYLEEGRSRLAALDTRSKRLTVIETPYTEAERGDIKAAPRAGGDGGHTRRTSPSRAVFPSTVSNLIVGGADRCLASAVSSATAAHAAVDARNGTGGAAENTHCHPLGLRRDSERCSSIGRTIEECSPHLGQARTHGLGRCRHRWAFCLLCKPG